MSSQLHLYLLQQPIRSFLVEQGLHGQLWRRLSIQETQCRRSLSTTRPFQGEEGKMAAHNRPGLEVQAARVSPLFLGLIQISEGVIYVIMLVNSLFASALSE